MDTGSYHYEYINLDNKHYCNVFTDQSRTSGVLRCSHEISVTFVEDDGKWKFESAWHCGVSDMEWSANEQDSFEQTFPDLLDDMKSGMHEIEVQEQEEL